MFMPRRVLSHINLTPCPYIRDNTEPVIKTLLPSFWLNSLKNQTTALTIMTHKP